MMLTLDKIYHASYVLKDVIRQTHIVKASAITDDCEVYLKPEENAAYYVINGVAGKVAL